MTAQQNFVLTLSCADQAGIVHAISGAIAGSGGNIIESQQFGSTDTGRFFMRVEISAANVNQPVSQPVLEQNLIPVFEQFNMVWQLDVLGRPMRTLIMASKAAHCLSDLLFRQKAGLLAIEIPAIVSNHQDLAELADFYRIPFYHIPVTPERKAAAEAELLALVQDLDVELVVLARYMQILSDELTHMLSGRVINIHHSFLPSFKGARPYHQAHQRGVKLIGATAHYATADLDEGPIIEQDVERVEHDHAPSELVALGQDVERRVLARAVRWHSEHRVLLDGHRTVVFK